ncbi:chorismate mutase [Litorimonas sp. WD9-15]|uniref:chorismate mutase n=1 Tax=Litorimonas sp. WD9-15 TaxID=3418716 RepID=UPI003CFC71B4
MSNEIPDIEVIRREIDRVDNALLDLIAERLELSAQVRKAKSGMRVWRPSREDSHVRQLAAEARSTSASLVSTIWAELMSASLAAQGPMRLHVALEGDVLSNWSLVRDRFGAALSIKTYPTTSAALAGCYAEDEGVAVLPSPAPPPGGMVSWWTALGPGGAMEGMHILAGLPRTGRDDWPQAVAVATADILPSGADQTLICATGDADVPAGAKLRAQSGAFSLYSLDGYHAIEPIKTMRVIGVLPRPIGQ